MTHFAQEGEKISISERIRRLKDERRSQSLAQVEAEKERKRKDPSTEEFKREVRERALSILDESGAYDCARVVVEEGWGGRIVENPVTARRGEDFGRHIGLDLLVKSPAGGSADCYGGMGIVIRASVETGAVLVLSGKRPVEVVPDSESGWIDEKRKAVEDAVFAAYQEPGRYGWMEGQWGEEWYLSSELFELVTTKFTRPRRLVV